ncbi:MAG TPA: FtsX-like permease family protein [candidate division Zixibacteria bacterium]|nr:FtsX-like permease family protein [candidate division Zixibacteria bacterium]
MFLLLRLARIVGKRAFVAFGVVTLLVSGLLAAINLASHHALKLYVEDQLSRLSWDIALYQTTDFSVSAEVAAELKEIGGIRRVESLTFLRSKPPPEAILIVDGKPLAAPWVSILAATDLNLLPPEARPPGTEPDAAFLALVGPEQHMGKAYLALQGARRFSVRVYSDRKKISAGLFELPLRGVVRLERSDINRYFMEEVGSISFVPYIGVILVAPYDFGVLRRFDALARGALGDRADIHVTAGEYLPEVVHVARLDRKALISGWDVEGSLARLEALNAEVERRAKSMGPAIFVDNALLVLLRRMAEISRAIGLATLLIAIPLLAIAWMLASDLSSLLILNERRTLGLMRLRGVPGRLLGWSLLLSIGLGGLVGGVAGLVSGTVVPLFAYEGRLLPPDVLSRVQGPTRMLLFLVAGLLLVLLISRRLVRYATTISPLEASRRVALSESSQTRVRFSVLEGVALAAGAGKIGGWIGGFNLGELLATAGEDSEARQWLVESVLFLDRVLDFVALPLLVHGLVALLVARRSLLRGLLSSMARVIGGKLHGLSLAHMSLKPHRIASFLLIVGLMASVSLYPGIASKSFEEKALRGATVQMGSELHVTINPADLVEPRQLEQGLGAQTQALRAALRTRLAAFQRPDVSSLDYLFEAILPGFFYPGYGLSGVPLYLIEEPRRYLRTALFEEHLGVTAKFSEVVTTAADRKVLASPPVAAFWNLSAGEPVLLGADLDRKAVLLPAGGVIGFLPGMAPRSVSDRQSYVSARIDYLNHLASTDAYLVATMDNPAAANLKVLIPRVFVLVRTKPGADPGGIVRDLNRALGARPLEVRELRRELEKVGGDMFIFLAMENMRIYLAGGVLLAVVAILAIALTNYLEDRRTLGLLRVRGVSPGLVFRFLASGLLAPALLGLGVGLLVALAAGFGLANLIWSLRQLKSVVHLLPTHLVVSQQTVWVALGLLALMAGMALLFSLWVFRRSARASVTES